MYLCDQKRKREKDDGENSGRSVSSWWIKVEMCVVYVTFLIILSFPSSNITRNRDVFNACIINERKMMANLTDNLLSTSFEIMYVLSHDRFVDYLRDE